ncbi:YitT family protein [Paenibacillus sp. BR2-3]|uniref:YitT family protein n=1 Tax=Paenibacillus sp. BR2-3 TaxID=3048494 RepID=UPI003977BFC5
MIFKPNPVYSFKFRRLCKKIALITTGSVIQGFGMAVFLFPHSIPSGGAAGLAVLLNYWFHLPMSIGLWLMNIMFLLSTVHYLGKVSAFGTIMVITITAVSVNIIDVYINSPFSNIWMDLLAGSIFLGSGIAVLLGQRVSNGGIGYVALAIYKFKKINPGKTLFWMNGCVFLITAYVIDWKIIIQAIICQWLSTRIVIWIYNPPFPRKNQIYKLELRKK